MALTANETAVLAALRQEQAPLGAYALLRRLSRPGFNAPALVYRALDRLVARGLVHRLESLNAYVTCAEPGGCKHGLRVLAICDCCGKVSEFVDDSLSQNLSHWQQRHAFAPGQAAIEVHGQCANCLQQADSTP